jgi:hypothetical protein
VSNPLEAIFERWSRLAAVSARLVQGGARRTLTGPQGVLAPDSQRDLNGASPWES